jgi:uncharacterized protein (DUF2141 family)
VLTYIYVYFRFIYDFFSNNLLIIQEEFEDTKGVIRIRKWKNRQHWPKEKGQKDKQRSTKHAHKTKDRVT